MGIIARQGSLNAVFIVLGVAIGAISNVFLYPNFFRDNLNYLGFLQLFIATAALFAPFLTLGSVGISVRYYPKMKQEGNEKQLLFYAWLLPVFGMIIYFLINVFFGENLIELFLKENFVSDNLFLTALFLLTLLMTMFRSLSGVTISRAKTEFIIFLNEVYIRVMLLLGLLLVLFGFIDLESFFIFHIITYLSQFIILLVVYKNDYFKSIEIPKWSEFKTTLNYGLYSLFDNVATLVVNKTDIFMIAIYLTLDKVAIYNFAFFLALVINIPNRALMVIVTPIIARSIHDQDFDNVSKIYQKSSLTQILLGGIIFLLLWLNFDNILEAGNLPTDFREAKYVFLFLGISKLIDLIGSVNGSILLATPYFKLNLYFNLILLILVIVLNILFIPTYGITGSAVATAIGLLLFNIFKGLFLYSKYSLQPFHPNSLKGFAILLFAFLVGYFIPELSNPWLDLIVRSLVTSIAFFPLLIVFKISEDINDMFYKLLRRFFK